MLATSIIFSALYILAAGGIVCKGKWNKVQGMLRYSNIEATRYRFCLFVDEESLQNVLQAPADDCLRETAFVNMLKGWWKPESLEDYSAKENRRVWEGGFDRAP